MLCRNVENPALLFSKENKIHSHEEIEESKNVFIMGYVTFSLGCFLCFISSRLYIFELFSFIFIRVLRPSLRPQNYV